MVLLYINVLICFIANGKKIPPAPGTVDQQLTALSTDMIHDELEIPPTPANTPYALQILLDMYRAQYMTMIDQLKSPDYKVSVENLIKDEKVTQIITLKRLFQYNIFLFRIVISASKTGQHSLKSKLKC